MTALRFITIVILTTGCASTMPDPQVLGVFEDSVWTGADEEITIEGDYFYPLVHVNAGRSSGHDVNSSFEVWLTGPDDASTLQSMDLVQRVSNQELRATVGAGLDPGAYSLEVRSPAGRVGVYQQPFIVRLTEAQGLALDGIHTGPYIVGTGSPAEFTVRAVDGHGEPTEVPVHIVAYATHQGGIGLNALFRHATDNWETVDRALDGATPAVGVRGQLSSTGTAEFSFEAFDVGYYDIVVAVDESQYEGGDGGIADADVVSQEWTTGFDKLVHFAFPELSEPYTVQAGDAVAVDIWIEDENGTKVELPQAREGVYVRSSCGGTIDPEGTTDQIHLGDAERVGDTHPMVFTAACDDEVLWAFGNGLTESTSSDVLTVLANDAEDYAVALDDALLTAGAWGELSIQFTDLWGNPSPWLGSIDQIDVRNKLGEPVDRSCRVLGGIEPVGSAVRCDVRSFSATDLRVDERFVVSAFGGLQERHTQDFEVVAGALAEVSVGGTGLWTDAGVAISFDLSGSDLWGNGVSGARLGGSQQSYAASHGSVACLVIAGANLWEHGLRCKFDGATWDNTQELTVTVSEDGGAPASSTLGGIRVDNGALTDVSFVLSATERTAGQSVGIDIYGYDQFANLYKVHKRAVSGGGVVTSVDVFSGLESTAVTTLHFDGDDGTGAGTLALTRAGLHRLYATDGVAPVGESATITVVADDAYELTLAVNEPWHWAGDSVHVALEALDAYGNLADFDAGGTLSSAAGDFTDEALVFTGGIATSQISWNNSHEGETLNAEADGVEGSLAGMWVVEDCGVDGPDVAITFGSSSSDIGRVCEGSNLSYTVSSSESVDTYALYVPGHGLTEDTSSGEFTKSMDDQGQFEARALTVIESLGDYCGAESEGDVYVGSGSDPLGPLSLAVDDDTLNIGAASGGSGTADTTVHVSGALDCSEDLSEGEVYMRTNRGELSGTDLAASGSGLVLTLSAGAGSVDLDSSALPAGGDGIVWAWADSELADGQVEVEIVGGTLRPEVWFATPQGTDLGSTSSFELEFSQAMDPDDAVETSHFSVIESVSAATATVKEVTQSVDGTVLTISLSSPISLGAGVWELTASSDLRDTDRLAGLAGTWDQTTRADYVLKAGAVTDSLITVSTASLTPSTFTPDGDDGTGAQADSITVTASSSATPQWWLVAVESATGKVHRVNHVSGSAMGATLTWTWDGTDVTGRVLPAGTYTLVVRTEDSGGNLSTPAELDVTLDNYQAGT